MPRHPRLETSGTVHHIIGRGITGTNRIDFVLFDLRCHFTDDTVMTVVDAILLKESDYGEKFLPDEINRVMQKFRATYGTG